MFLKGKTRNTGAP